MNSCSPTAESGQLGVRRAPGRSRLVNRFTSLTVLAVALRGETSDPVVTSLAWEAHPSASATVEAWSNRDHAARPGQEWTALSEIALEYRQPRPAGPEQGWFAKGRAVVGRTDSSAFESGTGAFNPASNIAANRHTRLASLYYWRHWSGDRFRFKLGQLAIDDDFMISGFAAALLHSAFGAMPSQVSIPLSGEAGYAVYPLAAPGVWFSATSGSQLACQCGVYSGSSGRDTADNHGWEWQHPAAAGVVLISEIRWQGHRRGPAIHVGASYHTGSHDNYEALRTGRIAPPVHAVWNGYAMVDAVLTRHRDGSAQLGAFARVGVSPQRDRSTVSHYGDAGLTWFGPVPGRANDVLAIGASSTWFGSAYRELAALRATETTVECTYRFQCTTRLAVQADVQRLRPAGVSHPVVARPPTTIVGVRALVQF